MSEVVAKWHCISCTYLNNASTNVCSLCSHSRGDASENIQNLDNSSDLAKLESTLIEWQCQSCTYLNNANTNVCSICSRSRDVTLENISAYENIQNQDDTLNLGELKSALTEWSCNSCTYLNDVNSSKCSMCSISRKDTFQNINDENENIRNLDDDSDLAKLRSTYENYLELAELDGTDLITCLDHFECPICLTTYSPGEGITLKDCLHEFCRECLAQAIQHSTETEIRCPYRGDDYQCSSPLQEREIRALVSQEVYDKFLARSVTEAEQKIQNSFHCTTANCKGWCILDDSENLKTFYCPICLQGNCIECKAIHTTMSCVDYQLSVNPTESERASATHLEQMLVNKEAMNCPNCRIMITKISGCDGMSCSVCKTAICWATRGPRWGPQGAGDISGGCRCKVNGRMCHPSCRNCH